MKNLRSYLQSQPRRRRRNCLSRRQRIFETLEQRQLLAADSLGSGALASHNAEMPQDVNRDQFVSPVDALIVTNLLNQGAPVTPVDATAVEATVDHFGGYATDVNRDGSVSAVDALLVINFLNSNAFGGSGDSSGAFSGQPSVNVGFSGGSLQEGDGLLRVEQGERYDWGVNLNGNVDWNSMSAWVDMTKKFRRWGNVDAPWVDGGFTSPFTDEGLPTEDFGAFWLHDGDPLGIYNFRYEGTGTVYFEGRASIVPGSQQSVGGVTTLQVEVSEYGDSWMGFRGVDPADPVRQIRMISVDYDIDTDAVFRDEFKRRLQPFSTLRFMGWNQTNNSVVTSWTDRRLPTEALQTPAGNGEEAMGGIAWEYMIQLANETQKDAWINVPHLADDNYVRELARLWRDNLDPSLKLVVEWSNETWNGIFSQSEGNGSDYYLPGNAGPETVRISQIFHEEFASEPQDRLHVTLAGQSVVRDRIDRAIEYMNDNSIDPTTIFDSIAIAPYFAPPTQHDYSNLDDLFADIEQQTQGIQEHAALAQSLGVELLAYESGQHLAAGSSGLSESIALAAQHDPRMGGAYREFNQIWSNAGGGLANHFAFISRGGNSGHWNLLESAGLPGSTKWDAMLGLTLFPGDANIDGTVDMADFEILSNAFGVEGQWWEQGDFDGDRDVDAGDLQAFYKHAQLTTAEEAQVREFANHQGIRLPHYISVSLDTIPSDMVTVTVDGGTQLETFPKSVVFAADDTALQPLRMEVIATHDFLTEGDHTGTLTFSASSTDAAYNGIVIDEQVIGILDNDPPDVIAPIATVDSLPPTATSLVIPLSVSFADPQHPDYANAIISGVAEIDVFVQRDDEEYQLWKTLPVATPTAEYLAESNHTYQFYAIARDYAGNQEETPAEGGEAEAAISVPDLSPPEVEIGEFDFYAAEFLIPVQSTEVGTSGLQEQSLFVAVDGGAEELVGTQSAIPGSTTQNATFAYTPLNDSQAHDYAFRATSLDQAGNIGEVSRSVFTARLQLAVDNSTLSESATATGTLTRNTGTTGDLVIQVRADKHADVDVPRTVVIPDGQLSVTFSILGINDHRVDGNQQVVISADAEGYQPFSTTVEVVDANSAGAAASHYGLPVAEGDVARGQSTPALTNWGINLGGNPDWATSATWVDLTNKFRRWGDPDAPWLDGGFTLPFTEQGLPTEDFGAFWEHQGDPLGLYTFRYEGTGEVFFDGNATIVPGSQETSAGVTTLQVDVHAYGGSVMGFRGVSASDPIRNIRMVANDYDVDTPETFRGEFKRRLVPFSTLRFMGWNQTNNSLVTAWGTRRLPGHASQTPADVNDSGLGGIAWEYMIQLANETQKDAWINVPHLADDEYIRELAKLWRDHLDPRLTVVVEWSNETWNGIFDQSAGLGGDYYLPGNAGPETVRVSNIFHEVFADEPAERLHVTLGGQSVVPWRIERAFEYMTDNGLAPHEIVDSIAIAPYFSPPTQNTYDNLDALFADMEQQTQGIQDHATLAQAWGIELVGYEAGQHLAAGFSNLSPEIAAAAQHDPRMGDAYREFNEIWNAAGGGLVNQFAYVQGGGNSGHWNLLESSGLPGAVKWDAMMGLTMLPGDANIDHTVNAADFSVIEANFGRTDAWWEQGDFDGDRDVDADDLQAFYKHAQLTTSEDRTVRTFAAGKSISLPVYVDLRLSSIPSSELTVEIDGGGQLETFPTQVQFFPTLSALKPVRIEVIPLDDSVYEAAHTGLLTYSIVTDDPNYSSAVVDPTTIAIVDNDLQDITPPVAQIDSLPAVATSLTFPITVSASDPANPESPQESVSGVAEIAIYVARDAGPFELLSVVSAAEPQVEFTAQGNHTYAFYSLATDVAGNVEAVPAEGITIEAGIMVPDLSPPSVSIVSVDTTGDLMLVDVNAFDTDGVLQSVEVSLSIDGGPAEMVAVEYANASGGALNHQFHLPIVADGTEHSYAITVTGIDAQGNETPLENAATRTVQVSKPTPSVLDLLASDVAAGMSQRSFIDEIDLIFNQTSGLDTLAANGLTLLQFNPDGTGSGNAIDLTGKISQNNQSIRINFGSQGIGGDADRTAGNGIYELRIDLDGDSIVDETLRFFRLFGDTNGDGIVDAQDLSEVNAAYGRNKLNLAYDLDGNGRVDGRDRRAVIQQQGASITGM